MQNEEGENQVQIRYDHERWPSTNEESSECTVDAVRCNQGQATDQVGVRKYSTVLYCTTVVCTVQYMYKYLTSWCNTGWWACPKGVV
jgi:hypothetical protein